MKRTTYIFIGLFVSGLSLLIGGMLVVYCLGRPYYSNQLDLRGEQLTKEIPACRVIWLTQTEMKTEERGIWMANNPLDVLPSKGEKNVLSCSEKLIDYLKTTVMGDTLKILLDYPLEQLPQEFKNSKYVLLNTGAIQLNITQDVECIVHDIFPQALVLKHLTKDSLCIDASSPLVVDSCDFAALRVSRCGGSAEFQGGTINDLHLDLNRMGSWFVNVEKCHIGTEYLTGHYGNVHLQKGECERMIWIPEKADSRLNVSLNGNACVTVME